MKTVSNKSPCNISSTDFNNAPTSGSANAIGGDIIKFMGISIICSSVAIA
eukprot:CAMPEP_0184979268 /NCGR_PEP_ID=MMETSP1098-20130426/9600_1 /TAXON_ID=89044 /ORGANISM="Spumella elongata, Strain CCAP 955/1" /LENGTH=49 /DNA_ID= /DNA_START= /DNA_END= /DNA_ORIENTATION=